MRKERKGQMPFTSEAVVAHWSSQRNIIFLSPVGGLHPWQHQEHPRSCGVSSKVAWRGVFINAEIWPTETTSPRADIMSQRGSWLGLVAPADRFILCEWGASEHHFQHHAASLDICLKDQNKEGLPEVSLVLPELYRAWRLLSCNKAAQLTDLG